MIEKFLKELNKMQMNRAERSEIRDILRDHIKNNPVSSDKTARLIEQRPVFSFLSLNNWKGVNMPALIIALIIAVSGGTAFAADGSLPGDALYPVKTGFNEKVRSIFAFSDEAEAELELNLSERRLEEAEELAVKNRLEGRFQANLQNRFEIHTNQLEGLISKLEEQGNFEAAAALSARLETMLATHEQVMAQISQSDGEGLQPIREHMMMRLHNAERQKTRLHSGIEAREQADVEVAAENRKQATLNKIENVQSYIDSRDDVDAEVKAEAEAKLGEARELVVQGDTAFEAGDFGEAFILYQQAHQLAQESKLIVNANHRMRMNIHFRGSVESDNDKEEGLDADIESEAELKTEEESESEDEEDEEGRVELESETQIKLQLQNGI